MYWIILRFFGVTHSFVEDVLWQTNFSIGLQSVSLLQLPPGPVPGFTHLPSLHTLPTVQSVSIAQPLKEYKDIICW